LREYLPGTFDKHIAYGQRERKLRLVAMGIMKGFKVVCHTEKNAKNLAYALKVRAERMTEDEDYRFGVKVRLDGKNVYAIRTRKRIN
jgi:hypothetical protein